MALLTQLMGAFTFPQVIILFLICFILYLTYLKITDEDYYTEINAIREKYKARMLAYLGITMRNIESRIMENVATLLNITSETTADDSSLKEYERFGLVVERNMYTHIYEVVKHAVSVNGFHDLPHDELKVYIEDRARSLLGESRKKIEEKMVHYPSLRGTAEERFGMSEATEFFSKVVHKSIKLNKDEKEEIKQLKKKYSLIAKINFVGAIINKLKK